MIRAPGMRQKVAGELAEVSERCRCNLRSSSLSSNTNLAVFQCFVFLKEVFKSILPCLVIFTAANVASRSSLNKISSLIKTLRLNQNVVRLPLEFRNWFLDLCNFVLTFIDGIILLYLLYFDSHIGPGGIHTVRYKMPNFNNSILVQ